MHLIIKFLEAIYHLSKDYYFINFKHYYYQIYIMDNQY